MKQAEFLNYVLRGNESAIEFIEILGGISQVWDDLIDGDHADKRSINDAFVDGICILPRNQFYVQYFTELQPLIEAAVLDWMMSNKIEDSEGGPNAMSWLLRDNLAGVIIGAAKIIGGMAWADKISLEVREHIHDEPIEDYTNGITSRRRRKQS